ncbi:MAG: hypothetical protein U0Y68_02900 [Blastocatellia bacterium]
MLQSIIQAITKATRAFFSNGKLAALFVLLYAVLVFFLYQFFTLPEARWWQVTLWFSLWLLIPACFFWLQAMSVQYVSGEQTPGDFLKQTGRAAGQILLISLPFIALVWLLVWGVSKIEFMTTTGMQEALQSAEPFDPKRFETVSTRIGYLHTAATTVTGLLLYFILPLLLLQLWISTVRDGLKTSFRRVGRLLLRAFAPRAVLTYLLGFVVFAVVPYFIITTRTPVKSPWLDLTVLGLRIALALLVALCGWVVTVGALTLLAPPLPPTTKTETDAPPLNAQAAPL